ncbi:transcriptional regulator, LacI family [Pedococcus cremeus]|uniref:Transcriptional regulator, LacI family n=1 Tax=Pedococcus cremeus TaxID=587636 RepID=A0A1H9W076_9MICO|nr:LacI family DNA-binding transcriptional regulator [Pedococcus cremeus]SES27189.1 transcriptional regulator, LacI family [Pedococcus cremeus]
MAKDRQRDPGATIYSVAELAGVSIASVSRVMQGSGGVSDKTRQKVLAAAKELNYVPLGAARSLAVRHHEAHGLVLPELAGPYYSELLIGFETRAAELGQSVVLLLADGKRDVARDVRRLATRVDGLVMLGSLCVTDMVAQGLHGKKPVLVIAGHPQPGIEAIGAENHQGARELTAHLLGHGRRRLLFVGDPASAPDVADRYEGFVAAHEGEPTPDPVRIPFREADGASFADRVLGGDVEADAFVCANDELALSIMSRLQDGGVRVPEDVAVVGWDDVMAARYVRPGLTTVRQPVKELGRLAADRLHERIAGAPAREGLEILPTQLVLRGSCGCAAAPDAKPATASAKPSGRTTGRPVRKASSKRTTA